jgi:DNA-binding MarR family transcriptional regulator
MNILENLVKTRKRFIWRILIHLMMKKIELTDKEKLMLYGLTKYPYLTDKSLSEKLKLKHSTVSSIRYRLHKDEYFRKLIIPRLQNMGCQMLVVIYTNFSPLIPLDERVEITGKTIEVFDEIFFSVGEQDKGFSLSLSKDYATIGRINDIRTQTFGGRGLLEEEYPNLVVFPFEISRVYRFFDFAPLLKNSFGLNFEDDDFVSDLSFIHMENVVFSDTEKNVFCMLVSYPEMSDSDIGREIGVSRHTVSRLRRRFEEQKLFRRICLPNLKQLDFEILAFYHIRFDPRNSPDLDNNEAVSLMSDSTVFMASRRFEAIMISVYTDYDDYKRDMMRVMQILKENKWIADDPMIRTYGLKTMVFIKDFKFAPITHKIVGCDFWVKKLLNI